MFNVSQFYLVSTINDVFEKINCFAVMSVERELVVAFMVTYC